MGAPENDLAQRRLRRAVLRAHHPDLGGDPAELARRLAALDPPNQDIRFVRRPRGRRAVTAWLVRRFRRGRQPRRVR